MGTVTLVHDVDRHRRNAASIDAAEGDFREGSIRGLPAVADLNYGSSSLNLVGYQGTKTGGDADDMNCLFYHDLKSFLPADANIVSAVMHYKVVLLVSSGPGATWRAVRIRRTDVVEMEATFNIYKTGSNWGTAGCNNTTTDIDTGVTLVWTEPPSTGWNTEDITTIVTDAWDNRSGICTFKLYRDDADLDNEGYFSLPGKDRSINLFDCYHIRITYELEDKTFGVMIH